MFHFESETILIFIALKCDIAIENLIIIIYNQNIEKHFERNGKFMEVLQSNTADNIYFWIEDRDQGNVNPIYESHGAYEIYIVCNGERRMYLGNVLYKVGTGDALMIPASTPHRSFGDGAFSGICIEFSDAYIKKHFTKSQYYKITECFKTPLISLPPDLLPIIRTYSLTAYNNVDMRNDCMLAIVDILYKHIPFSNPNAKRTFDFDLSTIGNYIQKNYLEIKGLDALSEHFGITKSHLCRVFKEHTGITITHYINALKIQRACLLLCESKIPIHDIYKMCGYDNSQYFNRVFKKIKEVTPNQFRQQSRAIKMWKY